MKLRLCDTNVWVALALSAHFHHEPCRGWLNDIEEAESILFCRATQQSLLRLLTNSAVLGAFGSPPLTNEAAWSVYEALSAG